MAGPPSPEKRPSPRGIREIRVRVSERDLFVFFHFFGIYLQKDISICISRPQQHKNTMGFDDSLFDGDVVEKVFAALKSKGSLTYYVLDKFEPAMTKEALERCEGESVQYHGYSLAYHMILPLMKVFDLGLSPVGSSTNLIGDCGFARLKTRELVLTHLLNSFEADTPSDFLVSVREQIATAKSLQEEAREAIAAYNHRSTVN